MDQGNLSEVQERRTRSFCVADFSCHDLAKAHRLMGLIAIEIDALLEQHGLHVWWDSAMDRVQNPLGENGQFVVRKFEYSATAGGEATCMK